MEEIIDRVNYHSKELALMVWARTTVMLTGIGTLSLIAYFLILFKPISDISMLHCVNVIQQEAKLTEWQGILDLERHKMDEREAKISLAQARLTPTR